MSVLESLPQLHFYIFAVIILGGALGFLLSKSFTVFSGLNSP